MTIQLPDGLTHRLAELARERGITPEVLAVTLLEQHVPRPPLVPQDDWERRLFSIGRPTGVALSDEALSSEGLYDDDTP